MLLRSAGIVWDSAWEVAQPSTGPPLGLDCGVEGRFSFPIRLKWWVGLLSTTIGKPLATRQDLLHRMPFRVNDPPNGPLKVTQSLLSEWPTIRELSRGGSVRDDGSPPSHFTV